MSCHGRSWKLRALILKKLETVRVAKKGGGGVPGQEVVVEGVKGVKYNPMPPGMYETGWFRTLFG